MNELKSERPNVKIAIRALGPLGWRTLKNFDTDLQFDFEDENLSGRVRETTKFTEHFSLLVLTFNKSK